MNGNRDPADLPARLKGALRGQLVDKSTEDIPRHDNALVRSSGFAFEVRPLVIDANLLWSEIFRYSRTGAPTVLMTAAAIGAVRLYCAEHVAQEVARHLDEWADEQAIARIVAWDAWAKTHKRLLIQVQDDPETTYLGDEAWRLGVLETCTHPDYGEPDDLPTARLALAIGAPVLSRDGALLRAVYGHDFDTKAHRDHVPRFSAMGELHVLSEMQRAAGIGTELAAIGAYTMVRRYPWVTAVVAAGIALGIPAEARRPLARRAIEIGRQVMAYIGAVSVLAAEARTIADSLPAPLTDPEAAETDRRRVASAMARLPDGTPTLHDLIRSGVEGEVASSVLGHSPQTRDLGDGSFQLGCPLDVLTPDGSTDGLRT